MGFRRISALNKCSFANPLVAGSEISANAVCGVDTINKERQKSHLSFVLSYIFLNIKLSFY